MTTKRLKTFFKIVILMLIIFVLEEGYMLYTNKKSKDEMLHKSNDSSSLIADLENEISVLNNILEENDNFLNELNSKRDSITEEIVSVEEKIKEIEELKATMASNSKYIDGVITVNQHPSYPTGCESVALYILLRYYGVNVSIDDIISSLPKGDLPHLKNGKFYGANPEIEFVGSPLTEYSYGVYNKPIRDVADMFKRGAKTKTGMDFDEVIKLVDQDKPVMVWATINMIEPYISSRWIDSNGNVVEWKANEHALVVIGYDTDNIIVSDPYTGSIRYYDRSLFISRYNYLGKRAVWYE